MPCERTAGEPMRANVSPNGSRASARRSSPRCRRWRCAPSRSISARGSPTSTARAASSRTPSQAMREGRNQYPPGLGRARAARTRSPRTSSASTGSTSTPTPRCWSRPARPRRSPPACSRWSNPGDEVVVLEPYYDSYVACIAMAGGRRVPITLRAPDFRLDLDELRASGDPADPAAADQQSAQPDRHGPHRRGATRDRRRSRSSTT